MTERIEFRDSLRYLKMFREDSLKKSLREISKTQMWVSSLSLEFLW